MTLHQLERDLDNAVSDGELLARTQITVAISYLSQGLSFEPSEIRALIDEIMSAYPEAAKTKVLLGPDNPRGIFLRFERNSTPQEPLGRTAGNPVDQQV